MKLLFLFALILLGCKRNKSDNSSWVYSDKRPECFFSRKIVTTENTITQIDNYKKYSDTFVYKKQFKTLIYKGFDQWERSDIKRINISNATSLNLEVFSIDDPKTTDDNTLIVFDKNKGVVAVENLSSGNYYYYKEIPTD